jgi:hypothetical protein
MVSLLLLVDERRCWCWLLVVGRREMSIVKTEVRLGTRSTRSCVTLIWVATLFDRSMTMTMMQTLTMTLTTVPELTTTRVMTTVFDWEVVAVGTTM